MDFSNRQPTEMRCPTCSGKFLSDETPALPFCSERCQLIDLGRWFNEEIGVPHEGHPGETPVEYRDESPDRAGNETLPRGEH